MEQYYNIKYKNKPKAYGIVVKVKNNKLEAITENENILKEWRIFLDNKGNLKVGKDYFFNLINKSRADELKAKADAWRMRQLYLSEESSSHLIGKNNEALY